MRIPPCGPKLEDNGRPSRDSQSRKAFKYGNVIENCAAKTRGHIGKVDPGIFEDLFQVR